MSEETAEGTTTKKSGVPTILWLLVLAAVVFFWWRHRQPDTLGDIDSRSQEVRDRATAEYDRDDILVDLRDDATLEQVAALEAKYGIDLVLVSDQAADEQFYRAHIDTTRQADVLAQLKTESAVEIAEPDALYSIPQGEVVTAEPVLDAQRPGFPNDPLYGKQWHMRQIGMPEAWKLGTGNGVIVAVLDTGVGYEDFNKKFVLLEDLKGLDFVKPFNFVNNTKHANDDHGHGSHVAGTIAQVTDNGIGVSGVALDVKIMPLKVLSAGGSGSVGGIADAIRYAADNGAKVINMSLGGAFPSDVLKKAVKYAHDKGVTVICAAGNESKGKVGYPAAYPGAVAVSATQEDEAITFYSNYGDAIDLAAPGGNTRDSKGGRNNPDGGVLQNTIAPGKPGENAYLAYMGTSMASPHAAGVAALVVGEGVTNPAAVEKVLQDTARKPVKQKYERNKYGAGIIDAPAAIKAAKKQAGGGGGELAVGLLMAGAVAAGVRRRLALISSPALGATYLVGVVIGACGLFFLPQLPILSQGLPSWDMSLLGPTGHGNVLFFSALIPFALLAVGYGVPKLRAPLAGLSIGVGAHLALAAVTPVMALSFGFSTIWLVANALVCIALAKLALSR